MKEKKITCNSISNIFWCLLTASFLAIYTIFYMYVSIYT